MACRWLGEVSFDNAGLSCILPDEKYKEMFTQQISSLHTANGLLLNLEVLFNLGPVDQQGVEVAGKPIRERRRQEGEKGERESEKRALHTRATRLPSFDGVPR